MIILQHSTEKEINDIYKLIARNIKKYRQMKNISQQELAKRSGYSYAYIRRIEGPKCSKNFSIQTICILAEALNIDIKNLFEDNDI